MRHFSAPKIRRNLPKVRGQFLLTFYAFLYIYRADDDSYRGLFLATLFTFAEENLRWGQLRTPGFPDSLQAPLQCREGFDLRMGADANVYPLVIHI
jgi:hypothetical protein